MCVYIDLSIVDLSTINRTEEKKKKVARKKKESGFMIRRDKTGIRFARPRLEFAYQKLPRNSFVSS